MEQVPGSRLVELEALLRRHPDGLTSNELAEALAVDATTIRRDLARLSSTGVEIGKRGRRYHVGFHHATRSLRLTPDEVLALYLACRLLSRQQSDRNPHAERVMQKLADAVHDDSPRFSNYIEEAALLQRSLPLDEGYLAVLETLTQAWSEGRVVHLRYRDRTGSITERNFHPFCIEPYGATNSCYTIGFDELRHAIRIFKLNRILAADLTNEHFDIPSDFSPNRLFSEAWGVVWHDRPPQMVDLRFFGDTARIVQEAFWHPSQRVLAEQDGTSRITFQVSEPLEMESWIRQWGASVEVIAPPELRKAIATNIHQLAEQYTEDIISIPYQPTRGTPSGEKGTVMAGYPEYYQRAIDAYEHGIKLVLGPTGLGKSSSIPDVVHTNPDRKFIYMANRKQLLEEMAARFKPGECVILRRDLEVVRDVLLTQRAAFEALLVDPRFKSYLEQARQRSRLKSLEIVAIRRACQQVIEMTKEERILPDWLSRYADAQARIVLQAVRWVLQVTRDENEQGKVYTWLVNHPVVEALFPAIPFRRRPEVRIMLVTLHKAFYGFFDGGQMRSLTDLSAEKRLVVFLDEFDFLEHDLVTLICRGPQITDPFAFMANFYRAMAHHKLPKADFPLHPNIRKRIEKIVEIIDDVQRKKLNYPTINQFTLEKTLPPANQPFTPAVFRTQHVISTNPLYINQTDRAFQLEMQRNNPGWLPARWLFNAVGTATTCTIALLKEMERDEEVRYWEILRQCFNNTDFFDQVAVIPRLPRQQQTPTTQRGSLLSGGYDLFDISDLQQRTDNEEVEVQYYQMLQTPENLLHALAEKFLVFGLSATADLPRCIHHFDLDWFDKQDLLLPTTDEDRTDIQLMSAQKAKQRGGHQMSVALVDGLDKVDPVQERLSQFLKAVADNDEFEKDRGGHRSQRMHRFFSSLFWLLDQGGERPRQLLFLNTFHQVRLLFTTFASHAEEAGVYQVEPLPDTSWFDAFTLTIAQRKITVVFFNAELATRVRQSKEAEQAFTRLFWTPDPVIVVTQYLSAGNGVNLQYTNEKGGPAQDFTHIGLLEAPYYFFTNPDPQEQSFDDVFAGRKENVWYQAKLFCAKLISEARFRQVLSTINRPGEWNARYQQGTTAEDCLLNQLAIFIQALGRVERTWDETPAQVALLSPEVFRTFQAFMGDKYETIREQHAPFTSANLQAVFNDIARKTTSFEREARRQHDTRLRVSNNSCREAIQDLVIRLETVRSQGKDLAARHDWEALRRAVLRHDFHAEVVDRYHCATSSPYYAHGRLNLTPELELLPLALTIPESRIFHLDAAYAIISGNPVIRDHFLDQGYDLQFDHPGSHFFTPYCLQAILAGAIGEEAITALLDKEGITVESLPDALFEVADLCIATKPWFIDCKNYNDLTLDRFSLPIDDPLWHPSLNEASFTKHAQAKLDRIQHHVGPDGKLIYINLVSGQERPLGYYTREFQKVTDFHEAAIIVVQGALDRQTPNCYQSAFTMFLADLKKALHPAEENEA